MDANPSIVTYYPSTQCIELQGGSYWVPRSLVHLNIPPADDSTILVPKEH